MKLINTIALAVSYIGTLVAADVPDINDKTFQNYILDQHNDFRLYFKSPALQWNALLGIAAQDWANTCNFQHSVSSTSRL
jgi:uncharacterized protein YkwD